MVSNLKQLALAQLREWREEDSAYYGVDALAKKLDCELTELYDWNHDSGVSIELQDEGLVEVIPREHDAACIAIGHMEWGDW